MQGSFHIEDLGPEGLRVLLPSAAAARRLGRALGRALQANDLIGLDGPLGAGKTTLLQGLARGLGVPPSVPVNSPTFTLINQYPGRLTLYHADLYRLVREAELAELGLWELAEAGGVVAVEWSARFPTALPHDRLHIAISFAENEARALQLSALGPRAQVRLTEIKGTLLRPAAKKNKEQKVRKPAR